LLSRGNIVFASSWKGFKDVATFTRDDAADARRLVGRRGTREDVAMRGAIL